MISPFPGMDPYLEQYWQDIHSSLIVYMRDELEEQLPSNLIARVEERIVFETDREGDRPRAAYPDVKISEQRNRGGLAVAELPFVADIEPLIVEYEGEPANETFINIMESSPGQRLVTVIEVLSLANKLPGEGQRQYRQKQAELAAGGVSLVEIDLLRRGRRVLSLPSESIPRHARTIYQVCVRRGWRTGRYEIYPAPLRRPLPAIRIPLREEDKDIRLNLQAVLDLAYRKGRYHLTLNYRRNPDPPLSKADATWAKALIKKGSA